MNGVVQVVISIIQTGVIGFVVFMIVRGLKIEIKTLQGQISNQNKLIDTMGMRIQETERIGDLYKKLISDFPQALEDHQQVITKTKDRIIYQLKSNVEEHELTIKNLRSQTSFDNPKQVQRASSISKLFLNKDNKQLLEFFEKLNDDKDVIVDALVSNIDFDKVLECLGYHLTIIPVPEISEIFDKSFASKYNLRTCTYSFDGEFYMITNDNEIKLTNQSYRSFKATYNSLT